MRKVLLTLVLVGLLAVPVLGQFPGMFGRGGMSGDMLLTNKSVQEELKLTDDQKKELTKAREKMQATMKDAFGDREAMTNAFQAYSKDLAKARKSLTEKQAKRLLEIEVQQAAKNNTVAIFKNEAVIKGLKLTETQKDKIKDALNEVEKDTKEVMDDARGDRSKMQAAMKKVQALSKDTFTKITKMLSEDQQKAWKDMQGKAFELKMEGIRPRPGGGGDKKRDDF